MDEKQLDLIAQLKNNVQLLIPPNSLTEDWCDEECCERFLIARDWDIAQSTKLLSGTLAWRLEKKPEITDCPLCTEDPLSHNVRMIGIDEENRPVLYTCFGQASGRSNVDANVIHLCKLLEDTSVVMKNIKSKKWVWIIDFEGFGVSDCSIPMMNRTIQLLDHYPARLGHLILLDSPWLFSGLWRTVSPLLPTATKSKIVFSSIKDIDTKLKFLGGELSAWLKREIAENRDPVTSKGKKYWEWLDDEGKPRDHDPRGAASFVESANYKLPVKKEFSASVKVTEERERFMKSPRRLSKKNSKLGMGSDLYALSNA